MKKESLEMLRERLIRDERVRQMIRVRAYEIYQMRGPHSGGQAQDWFQAEDEILAFLIADESQRVDDKQLHRPNSTPALKSQQDGRSPKPSRSRRTSASKQPTSKSSAAKRAASNKTPESKSKPKRTRKQTKPENSH